MHIKSIQQVVEKQSENMLVLTYFCFLSPKTTTTATRVHDYPSYMTPQKPLKTHQIDIFDLFSNIPSHLKTYWLPLCQVLTLGNAL